MPALPFSVRNSYRLGTGVLHLPGPPDLSGHSRPTVLLPIKSPIFFSLIISPLLQTVALDRRTASRMPRQTGASALESGSPPPTSRDAVVYSLRYLFLARALETMPLGDWLDTVEDIEVGGS